MLQFHFMQPLKFVGADGSNRIVAEADMMAELSGSPESPTIDALYAEELPGGQRYEIARNSYEFKMAELYLRSNPQERERIQDEWPAGEVPRRPMVHEHSTYWGTP